jgi:hypothetical protein
LEVEKQLTEKFAEILKYHSTDDVANAQLKAEVDSLSSQLSMERKHTDRARKDASSWVDRYTNLQNMMTTLGQQNARLIEENAKLKLQSATENMSQATVNAVRDEANKRLKEARERDYRVIAEIKQTAQEQCDRAGFEAEALKTQVQELQNSSNFSAAVL